MHVWVLTLCLIIILIRFNVSYFLGKRHYDMIRQENRISEYCYKYGLQVPRYLQSLETIQVTGTLHQLKTSQLICQKLKEFQLQLVPFQFQTLKQLYVSNVAHLDLISRCFKDQAFKCSKTVALISQHKDPMDLPNSLMLAKVQLQYLLTRQSLS